MLTRLLSALDLVGPSGDTTCTSCDEPIGEESLYSNAVALGLALVGVLVFSLVLIEDWKRSNRPSVLATVTSSTLHAEVFPRLVSPEKTRAVMILPSKLCPEEFLRRWSDDEEEDDEIDSRGQ